MRGRWIGAIALLIVLAGCGNGITVAHPAASHSGQIVVHQNDSAPVKKKPVPVYTWANSFCRAFAPYEKLWTTTSTTGHTQTATERALLKTEYLTNLGKLQATSQHLVDVMRTAGTPNVAVGPAIVAAITGAAQKTSDQARTDQLTVQAADSTDDSAFLAVLSRTGGDELSTFIASSGAISKAVKRNADVRSAVVSQPACKPYAG